MRLIHVKWVEAEDYRFVSDGSAVAKLQDRTMIFKDRHEAGQYLASFLKHYSNSPEVVVLALPRGGVPVAFEVAQPLKAPLDVFIVRKLGVPGHEELAMGAIASGGMLVLNHQVVRRLNLPDAVVDRVVRRELAELNRREQEYRNSRRPIDVQGKTVILVDDGLATGSSMRAALSALRQRGPDRIVVAVPVGAEETCSEFRNEADESVCATTPDPFFAVGQWYEDFSQTTDGEVSELLQRAWQEHPASVPG